MSKKTEVTKTELQKFAEEIAKQFDKNKIKRELERDALATFEDARINWINSNRYGKAKNVSIPVRWTSVEIDPTPFEAVEDDSYEDVKFI